MAAALASTVRDVDTPGVLGRTPPSCSHSWPDTDVAGTAHAANRGPGGRERCAQAPGRAAAVGLVCVRPGSACAPGP